MPFKTQETSDPPTRRWAGCVLHLGLLAWLGLGQIVEAQIAENPRGGSVFHPDSSFTAESLLRNAARQARSAQWTETLDLYERAVAQHGDALAQVPAADVEEAAAAGAGAARGLSLFVNVRSFVQSALARLPAAGLAAYRLRVDARAADLYQRGEQGDEAALRQLVDEFFASRWGDQALDLLGDAAFRDGRFNQALAYYRGLIPAPDAAAEQAVYPDPDVDRSRVAAKILLCRAALGNPPTSGELEAYRAEYPDARGKLAGREGLLADVLMSALAEDQLGPGSESLTGWRTFGGSSARDGIAVDPVEVGSFQWKVGLAPTRVESTAGFDDFRGATIGRRTGSNEGQLPQVFPIIVGDLVAVAEDDRVTAYRMSSRPTEAGDEAVRRDAIAWEQRLPGMASQPSRGAPAAVPAPQTLTASGDRIFACLGANRRGGGVLMAIRSNTEVEGKLIWKKVASEINLPVRRQAGFDKGSASYEGTPVADERRVYVALTDASTETWVFIACLDAETGQTLWVRYLGNATLAAEPGRAGASIAHRLLSLEADRLYYQTNMGGLACLDAQTGAIRWLATYPTRDRQALPEIQRMPNPAIVHGGRVIVAPADAAELFAFDTSSGRPLWQSPPLPQIANVLGVAGGKLFATGDRLYTLDVESGRVVRAWPEVGGYEGFGRGLLAGDRIYWPTRTEILVLDQATGGDSRSSIPLWQQFGHGGGNLAAGNGYLAVAQRDRLVVYCQSRRLIDEYRMQLAANPDQAERHYALGRLEEATGQWAEALASYDQAMRTAKPGETADGRPLAEASRGRRHVILMSMGGEAAGRLDWSAAEDALRRAAETAPGPRDRLAALFALADAEEGGGHPEQAISTFQLALSEVALRDQIVDAGSGRRVRADLRATERLRQLVAEHGREVYAEYDRRAEELLKSGRNREDSRALLEVSRVYPLARVVPDALLAAAELAEEQKREADAAASYLRLLEVSAEREFRARALVGLACAYERLDLAAPAREVAFRAVESFADVDLRTTGLEGTVATLLSPLLESDTGRNRPLALALAAPLEPSWSQSLVSGRRVYPISAAVPSIVGDGRPLVVVDGRTIEALDVDDGHRLWIRELNDEFSWLGFDADRLLVAGLRKVTALDTATGEPVWSHDTASLAPGASRLNPFGKPGVAGDGVPGGDTPIGRLHGFRTQGSRLYFLRGDRELLALDSQRGRVEWSFAPARPLRESGPEPGINPYWALTHDRVLVQVGRENEIVVLDAATGAILDRISQEADEVPWCADPVALDPRRFVLSIDPRTLVLLDLDRRADVWTFRADSALPWSSAPRVEVRDSVLLALLGGQMLLRLDPSNGRRLWGRALGLADLSESVETLAMDERRVYVAQPGRIVAYSMENGEPDWTRRLPDEGQGSSVTLSGPFVLAHARPGSGSSSPLASTSLLVCRREDGTPSQSIPLRGPIRELSVRGTAARLVVSTQSGMEVWNRPRRNEAP